MNTDIPQELKDAPRWVLWKKVRRGDRTTKIPFTIDGKGASSTNPEHWTTYQQAMAKLVLSSGYEGVGFVLGGGFSGVDFDDCRDPETGELAPWARDVIDDLGSYAEVSPSKTGVKVFCRGELPGGKKGKRASVDSGAIELYCGRRYFTVTGDHLEDSPREINDASDALTRAYRRYIEPPSPEADETAEELCKRALAALPDSVSGEQGHDRMFAAVCEIRRHGLDGEAAWRLIHWFNDTKCSPPWSLGELQHKWDGACREVPLASIERPTANPPFELDLVEDRRFDELTYERSFLVDQCVVVGEHLIVGGTRKALKTSIVVDMAVSVASGKPFLGTFEVPEPQPVIVISGESGGATLQNLATRVRRAKGIEPLDNLYWGLRLPNLSFQAHLDALRRDIERTEARLCVLDPAYLATLTADNADGASNVFKMGQVLQGFGKVGVDTGCTMCLVHHLSGKPRMGHVPSLTDLAFAGFQEWARQWLLLAHAKKRHAGRMFLNMVVGGSAGHSGEYALEIDEGRPEDPLLGRIWDVKVEDLEAQEVDAEAALDAIENPAQSADETRLIALLEEHPGGMLKNAIRKQLGWNGARVKAAIDNAIYAGSVVAKDENAQGQATVRVMIAPF